MTTMNHCHRCGAALPSAFRLVLDGGDEGKYWLRYHLEFGEDATREFGARFTSWDDLAVGNVDLIPGDEIVIVCDDDAPGGKGRFYVYNGLGRLSARSMLLTPW
jgi:hypothetical protein